MLHPPKFTQLGQDFGEGVFCLVILLFLLPFFFFFFFKVKFRRYIYNILGGERFACLLLRISGKEEFKCCFPKDMDYSSAAYDDTSLDLNTKPLRLFDDTPVGANNLNF